MCPFPDGVRVDGWVATGTEVPAFYDPMLAKLIVHAESREAALDKLADALARTRLHGIATNLDYLRQIVADERFRAGKLSTRFLESFAYRPAAIEVLEAGTYTSVQDYPGRVGYWDIGVPPSGPMDDYAFRMANRIVGNAPDAAGIEATLVGPTLRFHGDTIVALTGAECAATLDGEPVPMWQPIAVRSGQVWPPAARCRGAAAIWPCAMAWTCRSTWAAGRRSRWASSAATPGARCAWATCCRWCGRN